MRKIEEKIIQAIKEKKEMKKANTEVLVNSNGVFVKLYNTIIYADVKGKKYYSDGGWWTVTTRSRLYALGFEKGGKLQPQEKMYNLIWAGNVSGKLAA